MRERTNLFDTSLSTSISNEIPLKILDSNSVNNKEKLPPKYISSYNIQRIPLHENNIDSNIAENTEDYFQDFNFNNDNNNNNISEDFSSLLRPNSPTTSLTSSDSSNSEDEDEDEDDNNFTRITPDSKKYYGDDYILPGYTGDGGPYFPSLTAMWIFIWFTKNSIGNVFV